MSARKPDALDWRPFPDQASPPVETEPKSPRAEVDRALWYLSQVADRRADLSRRLANGDYGTEHAPPKDKAGRPAYADFVKARFRGELDLPAVFCDHFGPRTTLGAAPRPDTTQAIVDRLKPHCDSEQHESLDRTLRRLNRRKASEHFDNLSTISGQPFAAGLIAAESARLSRWVQVLGFLALCLAVAAAIAIALMRTLL
ncbi:MULTISPECIES: hypothetical protein [Mameliella]|uniref:hypothetical protein n=1 Tax=Mameliella TaxID=1434019 RepID=UPI000B538319|nr:MULTISPECIES: hypothetical protein [Mameliella]MCR9275332.1 hypothetical protein [Paracoccaceae bacterium]OWV61099.1 hypothetical protein CDZ98_08705 [Mameliella alba]